MRVFALIKRILLQVVRDKRTLALLFIAPLLILTLMNLVFNGNKVDPVLAIEAGSSQITEALKDADIVVENYEQVTDPEEFIIMHDLDGFLQIEEDKATLTLLNDDPAVAKSLEMKVRQVVSKQAQLQLMGARNEAQAQAQGELPSQDTMQTNYVYGSSETEAFDTISPVLVGFFVFFFVFLISGIGLLNERTTGTLERLMATPIRRGEIVAAYLIGYGLLALIQTVIIVLYSINVLDMVLVGSVWNVILTNVMIALVALSLGILLSSFASSEFQMVQFIPLVVVPQVFFSGIFSIEGMADWLQVFAKFMPLYYGADALRGVMYRGEGLLDISTDLYVLLAFAVVFIVLNLFALKKYRKL
ncbi:ABC transporter permease [Paenibacillus dakarensis]|uniref:ABC transporter permease n=1 Tax=Paenibacillus dakarensis TaxID=1527293 RepID=UPI0006D5A6B1|nr:ABC transporter permease [Paenibacillus dakarensis]